jgi:hypothetical protein
LAFAKEIKMKTEKPKDKEAGPKDGGHNTEAEKIKHGRSGKDDTGAPKGKNRANAGEETS